ncbi:MAG TPA: SDR family NAD(P)-dependent oxidoreductase [Polyangiales bacterium]
MSQLEKDSKVAVITGAARGIGKAIASELHRAGYRVVIADRQYALAEQTANALGQGACARPLDVTDADSIAALVREVEGTLGPIDVWVNNAGIMPTGRFATQDPMLANATIDVNYRGVVLCTRQVLPRMLERRRGHVVQIASATAAHPIAGLSVYSGTKAAVVGFSHALRRELRRSGVRVSLILPYLASTPMGAGIQAQPGFRAVSPEAVARAVHRTLQNGEFMEFVPRRLRWGSALLNALPLWLRDRVDDSLRSDAIGLAGDAAERARYEREAVHDVANPSDQRPTP